jgi:hypothetical protein
MAAKQKYVAYADLGKGSGVFVNPEDHGGEDSEDFQYMLEHRSVVPLGDPDAAIAMGKAPEEAVDTAKDDEIAALKAKIADLEAEQAAAKSSSGSGSGGSGSGGGGLGGSASTSASGSGSGSGSSGKK